RGAAQLVLGLLSRPLAGFRTCRLQLQFVVEAVALERARRSPFVVEDDDAAVVQQVRAVVDDVNAQQVAQVSRLTEVARQDVPGRRQSRVGLELGQRRRRV